MNGHFGGPMGPFGGLRRPSVGSYGPFWPLRFEPFGTVMNGVPRERDNKSSWRVEKFGPCRKINLSGNSGSAAPVYALNLRKK